MCFRFLWKESNGNLPGVEEIYAAAVLYLRRKSGPGGTSNNSVYEKVSFPLQVWENYREILKNHYNIPYADPVKSILSWTRQMKTPYDKRALPAIWFSIWDR